MIFRGTRGVFVFFFFYIFQQDYSGVAGDIVVNENGSFQNKTIFETLNKIGPKQCVRECQRREYCKAVNYRREYLECQLLWASVSNTSELEPHEKYQFISMASQTEVRVSGISPEDLLLQTYYRYLYNLKLYIFYRVY